MILPIVAYGDPVLRKATKEINENYPELDKLVENMFETMYNAPGVGLAAPQVGLSIRLFVVDTEYISKDDEEAEEDHELGDTDEDFAGIKRVFINPIMIEETGTPWDYEEGCLSIPGIREDVSRKDTITIEYYDENFELWEETFDGLNARVIQHEYDHIEGILFTDKLKPLKKRLIKSKLDRISKGEVDVDYKMLFPELKKAR